MPFPFFKVELYSFRVNCFNKEQHINWYIFSYKWYKDGELLKMGGGVQQKPGVGTIVLPEPLTRNAGEYQCKANNSLGTAVTDIVHLRKFSKFITI